MCDAKEYISVHKVRKVIMVDQWSSLFEHVLSSLSEEKNTTAFCYVWDIFYLGHV